MPCFKRWANITVARSKLEVKNRKLINDIRKSRTYGQKLEFT